jgi:WD40 repeat protein
MTQLRIFALVLLAACSPVNPKRVNTGPTGPGGSAPIPSAILKPFWESPVVTNDRPEFTLSPDGSRLALLESNTKLSFWQLSPLMRTASFGEGSQIYRYRWLKQSPGVLVASSDCSIVHFDIATAQSLGKVTWPGCDTGLNPYEANLQDQTLSFRPFRFGLVISDSVSNQTLFSSFPRSVLPPETDKSPFGWRPAISVDALDNYSAYLQFSPDNRWAYNIDPNKKGQLWHVPTGRVTVLDLPPSEYQVSDFSPDSTKVAIQYKVGSNYSVQVRDTTTAAVLFNIEPAEANKIRLIYWSASGKTLLAYSPGNTMTDKTMTGYESQTGRIVYSRPTYLWSSGGPFSYVLSATNLERLYSDFEAFDADTGQTTFSYLVPPPYNQSGSSYCRIDKQRGQFVLISCYNSPQRQTYHYRANVAENKVELLLLSKSSISDYSFSSDLSILAGRENDASGKSVLNVYQDNKILATLPMPKPFLLPTNVYGLSALGQPQDALVGGTAEGYVVFWDQLGNITRYLKAHNTPLYAVAANPAQTQFVTAGADGQLKLWDMATGELKDSWNGHQNAVRSVAWRSDGAQLASGSWDHTVRLWSAGESVVLRGHTAPVNAVTYSKTTLASAGSDGSVRLWDSLTGEALQLLLGEGDMKALAFSPDGSLLASGNQNQVWIWALKNSAGALLDAPTVLAQIRGTYDIRALDWLNANQLVVGGDTLGAQIRVYDTTGRLLESRSTDAAVFALATSPDRKQLYVGTAAGTVQSLRIGE